MTPEELADLHPRLFHVTPPGSWPSIERHGLLSASAAVDLFRPSPATRAAILTDRRATTVWLTHPDLGEREVNDQLPLNDAALAKCLDDRITPQEWRALLNARVFFWPNEEALDRLLSARMNRERSRDVLVFDTLSLARAHGSDLDLCPINSGATIRKPARRGRTTFTPLAALPYRDWRKQRGRMDKIVEITLRGSLPSPKDHLVQIDTHRPVAA